MKKIREKLENIRQDINEAELQDIFTHRGHGWLSAFRININQALSLIDEMEKEKRDNWPKRRMEIMSTRIKD